MRQSDFIRPMKILHVVYSFGIGGSESVAREVAMCLQERGHVNMVVALEHDGPLSGEFRDRGIAAHSVGRAGKSMLRAMRDMIGVCKEFRPDVIHTHHMYMLFHTVPAAVRVRAPIVHTEHEFWSLDTRKGRLLMPLLGRFCGRITAVNDDTGRFMVDELRLREDKLATVFNGIDLRRFNGSSILSRRSLGLSPGDKVAVVVARLEQVKNHDMLLHAWQRVCRAVPQARLLVIGEGSQSDILKLRNAELGLNGKVIFLGPRRDVHDILPLADVAVLSSRDEGLPMCLLEAMAVGLPVVSTDVGGVGRLVKEGEHGRLVPDDDDEAFARAVVDLFGDGERARAMGRAGLSLVKGMYDLETSVDRYQEMYAELAGMSRYAEPKASGA